MSVYLNFVSGSFMQSNLGATSFHLVIKCRDTLSYIRSLQRMLNTQIHLYHLQFLFKSSGLGLRIYILLSHHTRNTSSGKNLWMG